MTVQSYGMWWYGIWIVTPPVLDKTMYAAARPCPGLMLHGWKPIIAVESTSRSVQVSCIFLPSIISQLVLEI
jgi:hypothetical protein